MREISMQNYASAAAEYDDMTDLYSALIFPAILDGYPCVCCNIWSE